MYGSYISIYKCTLKIWYTLHYMYNKVMFAMFVIGLGLCLFIVFSEFIYLYINIYIYVYKCVY